MFEQELYDSNLEKMELLNQCYENIKEDIMKTHDTRPIKEALNAFGYILPFNKDLSAEDFAIMIRKHCDTDQAKALASEVEQTGLFIRKERMQTTIFRIE